jgi:hypothetical protein
MVATSKEQRQTGASFVAKSGNARAHAIVTRAVHLFDDDADAGMLNAPGAYMRYHQGVVVVLAVRDESTSMLGILSDEGQELFSCEVVAHGAATVTKWEGGGWERDFVRADA